MLFSPGLAYPWDIKGNNGIIFLMSLTGIRKHENHLTPLIATNTASIESHSFEALLVNLENEGKGTG